MANEQNIIGLGFDIASFTEQQQKIIAGFVEVYDYGKKISELQIKPGSTGGFTELKNATDNLKNFTSAQQNAIITQNNFTSAIKQNSIVVSDNIEYRRRLQASLDSYKKSQKEDLDLLKAGVINQEEYNKRITESALKVEQYKIQLSDLNREIKNQLKLDYATPNSRGAAQAQNAILQAQVSKTNVEDIERIKELNALIDRNNDLIDANSDKLAKQKINIGNYPTVFKGAFSIVENELKTVNASLSAGVGNTEDLIKKQKFLQGATTTLASDFNTITLAQSANKQVAQELGLLYGSESAVFQSFSKEVANGAVQVKKIDASVQGATKSSNIFKGAFSGLRTLANILPGIGISGLLLFAVDPIIKWFTAIKEATGDVKILNDTFKDGAKGASEQVAQLDIYKDKLNDLSLPVNERIKDAENYNKIAAEGNKINLEEIGNLTAINEQIEKQISLIEKQALAKSAQAQIAKFADKAIEDEFKFQSALDQTGLKEEDVSKAIEGRKKSEDDLLKQQGKTFSGFQKSATMINEDIKNGSDAVKGRVNDSITVSQKLQSLLVAKRSSALDLERAINLLRPQLDFTPDPDKIKGKGENIKASTKELLDAEFELYKIQQNRLLQLLQSGVDDTSRSLDERLLFAEVYNKNAIELAEKTAQHEIDIDNKKLSELNKNLKNSKGTDRNNILADIENTNSKIKIENAKLADDLIVISQDNAKRIEGIEKSSEETRLKNFKVAEDAIKNVKTTAQGAIDADTALRISGQDKLLHDGIIDQKQYAKNKAEIELNSLILSLTVQKKELEGLREVARQRGDDLTQLDNAINLLTGKLISANNPAPDKKGKGFSDEYKKEAQIIIDIEKGAEQIIAELIDAKYQRELDGIQKLIDANNDRKEQEINNINESTLSAQEKATQQILLDKQVAANNAQLAKEAAVIKRKQAIFDRDAAILGVVGNAAVAAFKLIAEQGYIGIAEGVAIGAAAAVQIGLILAKPIPSFGHGTQSAPDGTILIGEKKKGSGYEREYVEPVNSEPFWTTRPMLVNGLKGARITPEDKFNQALYSSMLRGTAEILTESKPADNSVRDAIQESTFEITRALRKQKQSVSVYLNGDNARIDKMIRN